MRKLAIVRVLRKMSREIVSQCLVKYEFLLPTGCEEIDKQGSILIKQSFLTADLGLKKKINGRSSAWPHWGMFHVLIYKRENILSPHLGTWLQNP